MHRWKAGDEITAERLDEMRRAIEAKSRHAGCYHATDFHGSYRQHFSKVVWVRLGEVVGVQSSSDYRNRAAVVTFYDPSTGEPQDAHEVQITASLFYDLPYDDDDLVPCVWQSGHVLPLWARTVRHFVTVDDGSYPIPGTCPNVYPIKFVRIEYLEEAGSQTPEISYLDESEGPDDCVLNLFEGEESYIPEGAVGWCYHLTGQWFTCMAWAEGLCSSSSSSLSSVSGSSSSNSSDSSSSSSSRSSSSSSSSESSDSSSSPSSESSGSSESSSDSSSSSSSNSSSDSSGSSSTSSSDSSLSESSQSASISPPECDGRFPQRVDDIDNFDASKHRSLSLVGGCPTWRTIVDCDDDGPVGEPGESVVLSINGNILKGDDGAIKSAILDSEGRIPPGCCCEEVGECDCCLPLRSYILVTFDGVVNDSCGTCNGWNQTFEVPRDESVFAGQCTFSLFEGLPCGFQELRVNIGCESEEGPGDTGIQILAIKDDLSEVQFSTSGLGAAPIDCTATRNIPFTSQPFGDSCDWTGATCELST